MIELEPAPENPAVMRYESWLVFGVGSPEPRFLGSQFNIGAAVVDLLADKTGVVMRELGPIQSALAVGETASIRLIKPNVIPEMAADAVMMAKNKCKFDKHCVVLIYGDPAFVAGAVKIKRKGGVSGHKIINAFNQTFGTKSVIRIRVGVGAYGAKGSEADDSSPNLFRGVRIAAAVIQTLVDKGYTEASEFANKASKGKISV